MAYEIVKSNGSGFTVFDGPPDGKTAMKIQSTGDLATYAGYLNGSMADALSHATSNGWLDTPTANQWLALIPQAQAAQAPVAAATFGTEVGSGLDSIIAEVKKASVGEVALFLGLGVLAWLAVRDTGKD